MTQDSLLRIHLGGLLLGISLLIAVLFYVIFPPERVARTLYFPGTTGTELSGERRLLPRVREDERALELLIEDVLLGPSRIDHSRVLPRGTRLDSLVLRDATVFIDLSEQAMLDSDEVHIGVETGLEALRRAIESNFRWIDDVVITIDGNVPFTPAYRPVGP